MFANVHDHKCVRGTATAHEAYTTCLMFVARILGLLSGLGYWIFMVYCARCSRASALEVPREVVGWPTYRNAFELITDENLPKNFLGILSDGWTPAHAPSRY